MLGRAGTDGSTQLYNTHDLRISGTEIYCYIHNISRLSYNIRCQKWQLSRFQKVGHKETMKIHAMHFIHKMMGNIKVKIYFSETIIFYDLWVSEIICLGKYQGSILIITFWSYINKFFFQRNIRWT